MLSISLHESPVQKMQNTEYEEFYRYTSGRWLWAEETRLKERYKRFNVPGLKLLAAKASGAQSCVSITKLAEGGFNKVFRLSMDNGSVVIARIPNPNVGLASKVRNVMGIPVPEVLAWDGGTCNSAESEYILMEQAKGTQLEEVWADMDLKEKISIVNDVVTIQKKLQSVAFSRYGNLYLKSDAFEGCSNVEVSGDLTVSTKTYAEDRFVIGPVAEKSFWETDKSDRGPWSDAQSYVRAIVQRERSKMPSMDISETHRSSEGDSDVLGSPQARLSLLDKFEAVSPYLSPSDPSLDKATLSHWDLRAPNVFVEDGEITSLIDWQDTWVGPMYLQERRPQLVEYNGEIMLRLPDYYEAMEDREEKAQLTNKVERSILYWYYGRETQRKNPALQQLFDLPLARIRREVVLFASEVWDGETIPLRECLHWDELNSGVPCPISFTKKEIEAHNRTSAGWNEKADFWSHLNGFVSRDGYTSTEHYEDARRMFAELRERGLAQLSGTELADFAEQSAWAKRSD
nr:altered inheritance of mitochondria protein 9, mitochondrial [Quercus suber]